jgi:hypothetical protein
MSKKDELKKLERKEDGAEIPLRWKDWEKFLKVVDPEIFWAVAHKYLIESGAPIDDPENEALTIFLSVSFNKWAPELFRAMDADRRREERYRKRFVSAGGGEAFPSLDETEMIELTAILKKVISSDEFQRIDKHARPIAKAILREPGTTDKEIAKELGVSQQYVSRIRQKIRSHLTTP